MPRILITAGPTREYLDPVRFLSNASSGRMGAALAEAALESGYEVVIVSGPVQVDYPAGAAVVRVVTTDEMLTASRAEFPRCQGVIAAAAPCDYRPLKAVQGKIQKTGQPIDIRLVETPDILASLGREKKPGQWLVGFALETDLAHSRALEKLRHKRCDLIVLNGISAVDADNSQAEVLDPSGAVVAILQGAKIAVAREIMHLIQERFPPMQGRGTGD